jgi:hypothetical protein
VNHINELSSIYENTEEELCTPDRDMKIDYSAFGDYKKHRKNRLNKNFRSAIQPNGSNPNFYERMDNDVKDRSTRDKEIKHMFSKRFNYDSNININSSKFTKNAGTITKRLFLDRKSNMTKRLSTSKSIRSLNISNISRRATSSKKKMNSPQKHILKQRVLQKENIYGPLQVSNK